MAKAGRLRRRMQLQSESEVKNTFGEMETTFATYATVWAEIKGLAGKEKEAADQVKAEMTYVITIRHRSDVSAKHRVLYGSRIFDVVSYVADAKETLLFLNCVEVLN